MRASRHRKINKQRHVPNQSPRDETDLNTGEQQQDTKIGTRMMWVSMHYVIMGDLNHGGMSKIPGGNRSNT